MFAVWSIGGLLVIAFGCIVFRGAPYVPSHRADIRRAFDELAPLAVDDTVLDIGSGDGVVLRAAAARGARAVGYELNPFLVGITRLLSWREPKVEVRLVDAWLTPFDAQTTVVYIFPVSRDLAKLQKTVQTQATRLGRPLRLVVYGMTLADWVPQAASGAHTLYLVEPLQ